MTRAHSTERRRLLAEYVDDRIFSLQREYARGGEQPTSYGAATMAALREADPASPGNSPAVWEITLNGIPPELSPVGHDLNEPSPAEKAVHAALCLYATHQQSRPDGMHRKGIRFGEAVRQLAEARGEQGELALSVVRRFHRAGSARSFSQRLAALRELVTLMRAEKSPGIGLDYGLLALDLLDLSDANRAPGVRLAWGRDLRRRKRWAAEAADATRTDHLASTPTASA